MPAVVGCGLALCTCNRGRSMAEVEVGKRLELLEIGNAQTARGTRRGLGAFLNSAERRVRLKSA